MTLNELVESYAPYCNCVAFKEGFVDYQLGTRHYAAFAGDSVDAQAYDRGLECAMKWAQESERQA